VSFCDVGCLVVEEFMHRLRSREMRVPALSEGGRRPVGERIVAMFVILDV
jgi:hypothetical protein